MDATEITKKIKQGESTTVEFKRCGTQPSENTFQTICAFANHMGGNIFLGVEDNGEIKGVNHKSALSIQRNIANVVRNPKLFSPTITLETESIEVNDAVVIRIWVPFSPDVHSYKGVVYTRAADADITVHPGQQLSALYIKKSGFSTERQIFPYLSMSNLRSDLIDRARTMAINLNADHPWSKLNNEELLRSTGLFITDFSTGKKGFTLAAGLLFGTDETISSLCPNYKTDAICRENDTDRYDDRIVVKTNLIEAYDELIQFCEKHLPDPFYLENNLRKSVRSIVCRELISNLLIHREFSSPFPAKLVINAEGVSTENASRPLFEGLLTPQTFNPSPKNQSLADVFFQIGRAEELGSGTRNMFKYSKYFLGSDPVLEDGDIFHAHIPRSGKVFGKSTVDRLIMNALSEEGCLSVSDAAKAAQVTTRTASTHLKKLVKKGRVRAEGTTRDRRFYPKW